MSALLECQWLPHSQGVICSRCEFILPVPLRRRCRISGDRTNVEEIEMFDPSKLPPNPTPEQLENQEQLLGDWTKKLLMEHGITPEFYCSIKAELGFAPTCYCDLRVEWLNKAHQIAKTLASKFL